MYIRIPQNPSQ